MAVPYQHKRGTRAQITAAASANQLLVGQVYLMTDEGRLVVATATNAFEAFSKQSEAGGAATVTMTPITATGTGTSQNITLPVAGLTTKDVYVFVNGMRWHSSEYSISGLTLTLTTNEAGDAIEIVRPAGTSVASSNDFPFFDAAFTGSETGMADFRTIPMTTIATDTHGGWNAGANVWTVPPGQSGVYQLYGKYRLIDGTAPAMSIGIGLDTSNQDGPTFFWGITHPSRNGITNQRFCYLNAGDQVRLFSYCDSGQWQTIINASLSIIRVK